MTEMDGTFWRGRIPALALMLASLWTLASLAVVGGGVEATALRVTLASDSTGLVSVDDGGGTLTVDGTVTANAGTGTMTVTDDGSFVLAANSGVEFLGVLPAQFDKFEYV